MSNTTMTPSVDAGTQPRHRPSWKRTVGEGTTAGLLAGAVSGVVLAVCGWLDARSTAGPLNGPSQWLFGRRAARRRAWTWRETGTGVLIHQLSAVWWGLIHQALIARPLAERGRTPAIVARAAATGALAYTVDYKLTPRRLQPGFDAQLSPGSLFAVYVAFAGGLAIAELMKERRDGRLSRGNRVSRPPPHRAR